MPTSCWNIGSYSITKVKQHWACSVFRWATNWEYGHITLSRWNRSYKKFNHVDFKIKKDFSCCYGENFSFHCGNSTTTKQQQNTHQLLQLQKQKQNLFWRKILPCHICQMWCKTSYQDLYTILMIDRFLLHIFAEMKKYLVRNSDKNFWTQVPSVPCLLDVQGFNQKREWRFYHVCRYQQQRKWTI